MSLHSAQHLTDRASWVDWFIDYKAVAMMKGVWKLADLYSKETQPHILSLEPPAPPTIDDLIIRENERKDNLIKEWEEAPLATQDDESTREHVRDEYRRILNEGAAGTIEPQQWIRNWELVHSKAVALEPELQDVVGSLAIKDFLRVIAQRLDLAWGSRYLGLVVDAISIGEASKLKSLRDYAKMFEGHLQQGGAREGVFATLNELPKGKVCPCMRTHSWQPSSCDLLRLASTGQNPRNLTVSEPKLQAIKERFFMPSYEKLKASLELLWRENGASTSEGRSKYPGSVAA
ncbi:hypothetical protein MBM_01440 [Drepanopeziza brunnea f. sp. 'multigermtubi' MB_m1]|uniref:Uncharacterized protein n=1 Tax=Marssonina brunnea f. sp. multigermtubi (strain MB_m1) TaxID=1072389 RepID=K1XJ88_MARBU|nr:uncharacterized protein MBM_01440 [Drepanopeziza brunnea f. sp. 'multigermtubi' MB_m1]EKD20758.1 hypothetical protein MBM_01440 [Drepanopeziza brunnea f. sp. 'multigermtubi' MB_m1]